MVPAQVLREAEIEGPEVARDELAAEGEERGVARLARLLGEDRRRQLLQREMEDTSGALCADDFALEVRGANRAVCEGHEIAEIELDVPHGRVEFVGADAGRGV